MSSRNKKCKNCRSDVVEKIIRGKKFLICVACGMMHNKEGQRMTIKNPKSPKMPDLSLFLNRKSSEFIPGKKMPGYY